MDQGDGGDTWINQGIPGSCLYMIRGFFLSAQGGGSRIRAAEGAVLQTTTAGFPGNERLLKSTGPERCRCTEDCLPVAMSGTWGAAALFAGDVAVLMASSRCSDPMQRTDRRSRSPVPPPFGRGSTISHLCVLAGIHHCPCHAAGPAESSDHRNSVLKFIAAGTIIEIHLLCPTSLSPDQGGA